MCSTVFAVIVAIIGVVTSNSGPSILKGVYKYGSESGDECERRCAGFDVIDCDLSCYVAYKDEYDIPILYEACLQYCAEEYMFCKYDLGCDIDKRNIDK